MTTTIQVCVPDIGEMKDIPIIELLVKDGDVLHTDQPIVTLESDKATLDVPTPVAGRVSFIAVAAGSRVSQGSLILTLETENATASQEPHSGEAIDNASAQRPAVSSSKTDVRPTDNVVSFEPPGTPEVHMPAKNESRDGRIYASPSIRRMGRELGADLTKTAGSGRGGRILIEDLYRDVRQELQSPGRPMPVLTERTTAKVDYAKFGEIERQPLSRIRRLSGPSLARNWATIPHVTNFDEADVTELDAFRVTLNRELSGDPKITLLPFLVKAVAATLHFAPTFNASLEGEELILKKYVNVGVAVDTPGGLMVPVIRGADRLGIVDIARELSSKAKAAQAGKLKSSDFEGGCFTISSLGGVGGTGFTPIINAPEIAILGVAKASIKPYFDGAQFLPRLILPLSLSWDHRATDGVAAARFLVHLAALLRDLRRLSL